MQFAEPVRRNFPAAAACTCTAEGAIVAPARFGVRSMNFGQHWRTEGIEDVAYAVEVPFDYFLAFLQENFHEQVEDLKEEQRRGDEPSLAVDKALIAAGYPPLPEAATHPDLGPALAEYWAHDLLLHWFGDGPPDEEPGYVLNTIATVSLEPGKIRITGLARRSGRPVRYQDV